MALLIRYFLVFFLIIRRPPGSTRPATLFPSTALVRSGRRLPTHLAGRFRYRTAAPGLQGSAATGRPHPLHGHALGRTAGAQSPAGRSAGTGDRGAEMKPQYQPLFPDDLSDEAAVALSAFLYDLAVACESRYLVQLRRYRRGQLNLYDPERPWLRPPPKPR